MLRNRGEYQRRIEPASHSTTPSRVLRNGYNHYTYRDRWADLNYLQKNCPGFLVESDLTTVQLENIINEFVNSELASSGLMDKFSSSSSKIERLLSEIKFPSESSGPLVNFLSTDFSAEDAEKWIEIDSLLNSIYNYKTGHLRAVHDHFFNHISYEQITTLVTARIIALSPEEVLFLRMMLVRCCLFNLRQSTLPSYGIINIAVVDFRKQVASHLEEKKNRFLEKEGRAASSKQDKKYSQALLSYDNSTKNLHEEVGCIIRRSSYTKETLKTRNIINFGSSETTSSISRCLPFFSLAVEMCTELATEHQGKGINFNKYVNVLTVIDNLRWSILMIEKEVSDNYQYSLSGELESRIHRIAQVSIGSR